MKGIDWGILYNQYKDKTFNPKKLEESIIILMMDEGVTNKKGIYEYLVSGKEKYLSIRVFSPNMKRETFERQKGVCIKCNKPFEIELMEADHTTPWSKGGKTSTENCQMLCVNCNRTKSDV